MKVCGQYVQMIMAKGYRSPK